MEIKVTWQPESKMLWFVCASVPTFTVANITSLLEGDWVKKKEKKEEEFCKSRSVVVARYSALLIHWFPLLLCHVKHLQQKLRNKLTRYTTVPQAEERKHLSSWKKARQPRRAPEWPQEMKTKIQTHKRHKGITRRCKTTRTKCALAECFS